MHIKCIYILYYAIGKLFIEFWFNTKLNIQLNSRSLFVQLTEYKVHQVNKVFDDRFLIALTQIKWNELECNGQTLRTSEPKISALTRNWLWIFQCLFAWSLLVCLYICLMCAYKMNEKEWNDFHHYWLLKRELNLQTSFRFEFGRFLHTNHSSK